MVGVVIGSYQLVRKLGEGGMGVVYLGQHTLLGRRAAIKVLLPALSARQDIVSRFFNEARAVTSINDPGIVQVFDFGYHSDGSAFIVMEFLEGEPLDQRLAKLRRFSVYEALRLCRQLATSLAAAHAAHIVHRDLKPENVFLVRDAEVASGERSKILDFGIAKLSDEHPGKIKTHAGALMGTPIYMSPEQCRGLPEIDHRSDIYALACVLFHLITGRPPFEGEGMGDIISAHIREPAPAPSSLVPGIPPSVDALVLRCLAKAPADRYQTMVELAGAIGQVLAQVPPDAALQYAPGGERGPAGSVPPTYHSRPPTPSPPAPYPAPTPAPAPYPPTPASALYPPTAPPYYAAPAAPTTLGANSGQIAPTARSPRVGRWIAGVLVLGAVAAGIGIMTRNDGNGRVAVNEVPGSGAPPMATPPRPPATSPPVAPPAAVPADANAAVAVAPAAVAVDAAVAEVAVESTPAAPATRTPAHPPKPRDRTHKATTAAETTPAPSSAHGGTTAAAATSPATPARSTPAAPAASGCSKADFASVYEAAVPPPGAVRGALKHLKACRDAGAISDADFDRYQSALVAKL